MKENLRKVHLVFAVFLLSLLSLGMVGAALVPVVNNVAKDPTQVPPAINPKLPPQTVIVNLTAKEVIAEIAPGKRFLFWTFMDDDGKPTVPGPMIRLREGDTLVINLKNDMDDVEPHNIDFHASMGPGGGAAVTNVEPGQTASLKIKAMRAGAYVYHCAGEGKPWEHVSHGMYGLIQVDPAEGLPTGYKEFYVGQSDWYLTDTAGTDPTISADPNVIFYNLDDDKASAEHPDLFTLNGHTNALTDSAIFGGNMRTRQNDKARIFFVTGGPNIGSNFHIIGQIFDKVYTGNPETFVKNEETQYIAPGSAAVLELSTLVPGKFLLVDHSLWRVPKGALGFLHVDAKKPASGCDPLMGGGFICTNPGSWPFDIYSPVAFGTGH